MASNKEIKESNNKENKLTDKQKEIILTVGVLIASIIVGTVIGYFLFEAMHS